MNEEKNENEYVREEQLLKRGLRVSLRTDERTHIKTALILHATERLQHEVPSRVSFWNVLVKMSASVAMLLLVIAGTAYASRDSLPGEPLFAVKVHVLEEAVGLTYFEPSERIQYEISLMETRLDELKQLTKDTATATDEVLAEVYALIDSRAEHIASSVSEAEGLGDTEQIQALLDLSTVVKAHEVVAETTPELRPVARSFRTTRSRTTDALREQVIEFTDTAPRDEVTE
jgi:hypothetical protein